MAKRSLSQLTLHFAPKKEATFASFYAGSNQSVVTSLYALAKGCGEKMVYLYGAKGEGLSHLLQAVCHEAHQHQLTSVYLPLGELITLSPELLRDMETLSLICLDDIEAIAGKHAWEEGIFHLYNRIKESGGSLLVASHTTLRLLPIALPDLLSRLTGCGFFSLTPLTDHEKWQVLAKHANLRGIALSEEVGRYLLTHFPRTLRQLLQILDQLDQASLAAKRAITIPLVREVLICPS